MEIKYNWGIDDKEKQRNLTWSSTSLVVDTWDKKSVKIVVDLWMHQWSKKDNEANLSLDHIETPDYIVLTHAHMDHCGRIPYIVKNWYSWDIICTKITKEASIEMCLDYVRLTRKKIDEIEEKNKKTILLYKKLFKIKNIYEQIKFNWLKKEKKQSLKEELLSLVWEKDIDEAYEESCLLIAKAWFCEEKTFEEVIKWIIQEAPELLYDEEDVKKMWEQIKILEIWEELKIEKYINIFTLESKYIDLIPEMVKNWYKKSININPNIKDKVIKKWENLLEQNQLELSKNKEIIAQNNWLRKILEEALTNVEHFEKTKTTKNEFYDSQKSILDSYKVSKKEDIENALTQLYKEIFNKNDLNNATKLLKVNNNLTKNDFFGSLTLKFIDAWHIEWSVQAVLKTTKNKVQNIQWPRWPEQIVKKISKEIILTWDLWRIKDPNLAWTPDIYPWNLDYLQIESTYAWREHIKKEFSETELIESIKRARWKVIIPCFSMQRTQEIVILLIEKLKISKKNEIEVKEKRELIKTLNKTKNSENETIIDREIKRLESDIYFLEKDIFSWEIILDSPLSQKISNIYLSHKWDKYRLLSEKLQEEMFWRTVIKTLKSGEYKELYNKKNIGKKQIIISSSWMCEWWAVLNHLENNLENPNSTIIFVWYTPETTNWGMIKAWNPVIINWVPLEIKAKIVDIKWFSWHIDEPEILEMISKLKFNKNATISLTHGWFSRYALAEKIKLLDNIKKQKVKIIIPNLWDSFKIK